MLWAVMGVGMLFNALQQNKQAAQQREMTQALQAENQRMMASMQESQASMNDCSFAQMAQIQTGLPDYPEENFSNLADMQSGHADARQAFTEQLDSDLQQAKTAFFDENHYDTKLGADGKHEVACGEDGKPLVKQGKESPENKVARLGFESEKKADLQDKQATAKEQFIQKERENFKEFLAMNREQLGNPYVQGELQKMVVASRKKSLDLQQGQEDERWRVDMPPSEEIAAKIDGGLKQLHDMDQKHLQAEEESPDAQALIEHDQKVAAVLYDHKQRAQQERAEDNFSMDPRKMMAVAQQRSKPKDVGEVLPSYLTNALYEMNIYSV